MVFSESEDSSPEECKLDFVDNTVPLRNKLSVSPQLQSCFETIPSVKQQSDSNIIISRQISKPQSDLETNLEIDN